MRAGMALATGGACGATVPAVAWAVGGASGPVWAAVGAALGVLGGSAHLVTLRRALAGQEDDLVAHVRDVAGRLLAVSDVVPEPGWEPGRAAVSVPSPRAAGDAEPEPEPGPGSRSAVSVRAGSVGAASLRTSARAVAGPPIGDLLERTVVDLVATARRSTGAAFRRGPGRRPRRPRPQRAGADLLGPATAAVLGWRDEELHGQPLAGLVHSGDLAAFAAVVDAALAGTRVGPERARVRVRTARNEWRVLDWSARTSADASGILLSARDVTDHAHLEADLLHQATHDPLTGLPNRTTLMRLAAEAVVASRSGAAAVGPDDRPRPLQGRQRQPRARDRRPVAGAGRPAAAGGAPPARHHRPARRRRVRRPAAGCRARTAPAGSPSGWPRPSTPRSSSTAWTCTSRPRSASRSATGPGDPIHAPSRVCSGRPTSRCTGPRTRASGIVRFEPEHDSGDGRSRLELSADLRRAIAEEQLVLHYQPVVDVVEGRLVGVEALVRWQHPERGLLSPGTFLPLAEQTGLIIPLSRLGARGPPSRRLPRGSRAGIRCRSR